MKLGTKINLVLVIVVAVTLTIAFSIIVSIEASTTKKQVTNDAQTAADIFHTEIERMFKQIYDQETRLQNTVDELSRIEGVNYVNVTSLEGTHLAATDHKLIGTKATERDIRLIEEIKKGVKVPDITTNKGNYIELERRIPIHLNYGDDTSRIINVIEVEVTTRSNSAIDLLQAQRILQAISASTQQTARSIIVTREEDINAIQAITNSIVKLGKLNEKDKFGFYHDFIIFDSNLGIVANTGDEHDEFKDDPAIYNKYRIDVLSGESAEERYTRIHEEYEVNVRVKPIVISVEGKDKIVGVKEIHVLTAAYTNKITILKIRMLGIGIAFTSVVVLVLAFILRKEVVLPITRYSMIARKIADGDLSQTVEVTSSDEIGHFGEVFNSMVKNLREVDKLKSDFISVAAHQLRTPLSGVKWVLKLLLDGDLGSVNEDQHGMLKRGYDTNEKMIQLVNDLLNVARIENGNFGYKFGLNDFMKLLNTLLENTVLPSKERGIEIVFENRAGQIPEFTFDQEKLLIALQNIVDNAMKYTLPGGKVRIMIESLGDYLEIKITDTGVGIPKADIEKLFSKFFRAANVIHLQTDGSGLGLFIVKSIIMRHGGQIWVDSVEGTGTTFTVVIPVVESLLPKEEKAGGAGASPENNVVANILAKNPPIS